MAALNSFGARTRLNAGGSTFDIFSLAALERAGHPGISRLPYSLKILLENLLRREDGRFVGMYVNDWTVDYGPRGREAVRALLKRAWEAGLVPAPVDVQFVG